MAPIRIALIGLSANAKTSWAAESHLPYLLSPRGRQHYTITALLNSSTGAAEAARAHYGLPGDVKVYGNPEALARDPDVELVVCNTRVDTHFDVAAPSARAGKAVYVEWPPTRDLESSEELASLAAKTSGGASIVGLQGRVARVVLKVREVVDSGRVGKVLGSDVEAYGNLLPRDELPGGWRGTAFESRLQIQRPEVKILGAGLELRRVRTDVPDLIALHGAIRGRNTVDGATLAVRFRNGPPFKGRPAFVWRIVGEKGEVEIESPSGPYLHSDSYDEPIVIRAHEHGSDEVADISWGWETWQEELPVRARNVGEVYERFARWVELGRGEVEGGGRWPTLQDAVLRMRELDTLFQHFDKQ
ncbi:oxidoreductase family protein [Colletotrichum higginsianum]|nr:oxidoreductase family protein [Colletotrichum higginsianum]